MSDTFVTSQLTDAEFQDGTTMSGTWTTQYDANGAIVGITDSSFTVTGPGGSNTFAGAYAPYPDPRNGDYEMTFPARSGNGSYDSLYVDWSGEDPGSLNGGDQVPYTSIRNSGGEPLTLTGSGMVTNAPPCFVRGTMIATPDGEIAVEDLAIGMTVRLASGGDSQVLWVGRRRMDFETLSVGHDTRPVSISAGALGGSLPVRPLRVSPDHSVFVDGVLVPAGLLVNERSITRMSLRTVEYFHIELDRHQIILAEGAAVESYLDSGNRSTFANAPIVAIRPELEPRSGETCAEMVLGGERLDEIRARLAGIADARLLETERLAG